MTPFEISISTTNYAGIVKFEANKFLLDGEGQEFANIDEAKGSPLAQKLFYLPFVKTVYIAQNFVAVEKYDIVEWTEVQDEVAEAIESHLNAGDPAVQEKENDKSQAVNITVESTPNPAAAKFVANKKLVSQTAEFKSLDAAKNAPLAQELFQFPFVQQVFLDEDYIAVTKNDLAEWNDITDELREFIQRYLQQGKQVIEEGTNRASGSPDSNADDLPKIDTDKLDDVSKEIVEILEEYVKPAVANDGGNIKFESYDPDDKEVRVILQGACSGCPSSTITLKNGIEQMLREMLQGKVETVEAING